MHASVSASQLAGELDVSASRLTRWLRKQRDAGMPLLLSRKPGAPWVFSREHADRLAEAFLSSAARVSDSEVQRRAEGVIRGCLAERLGVPLEPRVVRLAAGAPVHVDAVSVDGAVMAEIFARQGQRNRGHPKNVA